MYTTLPLFPDVSFLKNVSLFSMPCFKKKKQQQHPRIFSRTCTKFDGKWK